MSRIPVATADQQPEKIREWMTRRGDLNVFRLLANAPQVFAGWTQMVDELFDKRCLHTRRASATCPPVACSTAPLM